MGKSRGFDMTVHKRNGKGAIVDIQPYRLVIENGIKRFERPVDSGFWYDEAGTLIKEPKELKESAELHKGKSK